MGVKSPIESFYEVFAPARSADGDRFTVSYHGDRGWRKEMQEVEYKRLFSQYLLAGNQYFLNENWGMAQVYYNSALEISDKKPMKGAGVAEALRRLLESYKHLDRYEVNLLRHLPEYARIMEESGDSLIAAGLYSDAAGFEYDRREYHKAIDYATELLGRAVNLQGDSLKTSGYAIRGRSRFHIGELDLAEADFTEAIRLLSAGKADGAFISLKLELARIYNLKGLYGESKLILDSFKFNMDSGFADKEIYADFLIEQAKYYMGTYRNAAAEKHLEKIINKGIFRPEAELLLDIGHANLDTPYNRAEELLANFGDRLGHVHVSDNRGGRDDMHLPLGVGSIDWIKKVRFLKNAGYDGTITLEVFGEDDDYLVLSKDKLKRLWEQVGS